MVDMTEQKPRKRKWVVVLFGIVVALVAIAVWIILFQGEATGV